MGNVSRSAEVSEGCSPIATAPVLGDPYSSPPSSCRRRSPSWRTSRGSTTATWTTTPSRPPRPPSSSASPELEQRARLVLADLLRRRGNVADAGRQAQEIQRWATDHDAQQLLARSHFVLTAVFQELGDLSLALEHAVRAVELLAEDAAPEARIDHLARLADCLGLSGDLAARDRYDQVLRLAEELGDVDRQLLVLNNRAYYETLSGSFEEALVWSTQAAGAGRPARRCPMRVGRLDTIGRVLMELGRLEDAEDAMLPGLRPEALAGVAGRRRRRGLPADPGRDPAPARAPGRGPGVPRRVRAPVRPVRSDVDPGARPPGAGGAARRERFLPRGVRGAQASTATSCWTCSRPSGTPAPGRCRRCTRPPRPAGRPAATASSRCATPSPGSTTGASSTTSCRGCSAGGGGSAGHRRPAGPRPLQARQRHVLPRGGRPGPVRGRRTAAGRRGVGAPGTAVRSPRAWAARSSCWSWSAPTPPRRRATWRTSAGRSAPTPGRS